MVTVSFVPCECQLVLLEYLRLVVLHHGLDHVVVLITHDYKRERNIIIRAAHSHCTIKHN